MLSINNDISLSYAYMGYFTGSAGWIHSTVRIDTNELIFVTKGTAYLEENNKKYTLKQGDFLFLSPNIPHGGFRRSEEEIEFFYLHFYDKNFSALHFQKRYTISDYYNYINEFRELNHYVLTKADPALIESKMLSLLLKIKETNNSSQNKLCFDVAEYIRIHLNEPPSVESLAAHFQYCPAHLSRLFSKVFHITLKQFIDKERLSYIKSYLSTTNYSIKQIADLCHFENENILIKFFKYHAGTTPTNFRNKFYASHLN